MNTYFTPCEENKNMFVYKLLALVTPLVNTYYTPCEENMFVYKLLALVTPLVNTYYTPCEENKKMFVYTSSTSYPPCCTPTWQSLNPTYPFTNISAIWRQLLSVSLGICSWSLESGCVRLWFLVSDTTAESPQCSQTLFLNIKVCQTNKPAVYECCLRM